MIKNRYRKMTHEEIFNSEKSLDFLKENYHIMRIGYHKRKKEFIGVESYFLDKNDESWISKIADLSCDCYDEDIKMAYIEYSVIPHIPQKADYIDIETDGFEIREFNEYKEIGGILGELYYNIYSKLIPIVKDGDGFACTLDKDDEAIYEFYISTEADNTDCSGNFGGPLELEILEEFLKDKGYYNKEQKKYTFHPTV